MDLLNSDLLAKRSFVQVSSTSHAVQIVWNHPDELQGQDKKSLSYELQYGVGAKVNKVEQFRGIYNGKAHKCIITDLMPKTNYRFRVVSLKGSPNQLESVLRGEWSDVISVYTKDI